MAFAFPVEESMVELAPDQSEANDDEGCSATRGADTDSGSALL